MTDRRFAISWRGKRTKMQAYSPQQPQPPKCLWRRSAPHLNLTARNRKLQVMSSSWAYWCMLWGWSRAWSTPPPPPHVDLLRVLQCKLNRVLVFLCVGLKSPLHSVSPLWLGFWFSVHRLHSSVQQCWARGFMPTVLLELCFVCCWWISLFVSVCLSFCLPLPLSVSLSLSPPLCLCLSVCLSLSLSPPLCLCLSVCLSLSPPLCLCLSLSPPLPLSLLSLSLSPSHSPPPSLSDHPEVTTLCGRQDLLLLCLSMVLLQMVSLGVWMEVTVFRRPSMLPQSCSCCVALLRGGHSCILASLKRGLTVECALGAVVLCLVPECRKDSIHCLERQQQTTIFSRRTGRCRLLQHLCRLGLALTEDRMLKSQY